MNQTATQKIIDGLRRGKNELLQEIYTYCKDHCMHKLTTYEGCSVADAEDLFMDAILIFRQNVLGGKVQDVKKLREYVYTICLNRKRVQYRQQQRAERAEMEVRQRFYEPPPEATSEETADDLTQWEALATAAFEQLNEKCQAIIQSYYYEGLSMEEIAQQLHLANANVAKVTKCRCYKQWMKNVETLKDQADG